MIEHETRWDEIATEITNSFFLRIEQFTDPVTMETEKKNLIREISDALFSEYMEGLENGGYSY